MIDPDISNAIQRLQDWYISNCNDDWEHAFGFSLSTLDNPGWSITVDLDGTSQENQTFKEIKIDYDHNTIWIFVRKEGNKLKGACGPNQLGKMISIITNWLRPRGGHGIPD